RNTRRPAPAVRGPSAHLTTAHHLRTGQRDRSEDGHRSGPFVRCMRMLDGLFPKLNAAGSAVSSVSRLAKVATAERATPIPKGEASYTEPDQECRPHETPTENPHY